MVIGIAGLSGSGKSTFALKIKNLFKNLAIINQDNYYLSVSPKTSRNKYNFDKLSSLDINLLMENILDLKKNKKVSIPSYSFENCLRGDFITLPLCSNILLEGHLLFTDKNIFDLIDFLIYIDVPSDVCLLRRLERDKRERFISYEENISRYKNHVCLINESIKALRYKADFVLNDRNYDDCIKKLIVKLR